jgi:hypothetical protein
VELDTKIKGNKNEKNKCREEKIMPKLNKILVLSLAVLAAQLILSKWIYPFINLEAQQLFVIQPATGVGGQVIGNTILSYLTSYVPFDIFSMTTLVMFLGTFALMFAGLWIYEQRTIKLWQGKNLTGRLFWILAYGHVVLYAVLLLMKQGVPGLAWNLAFGLLVNLLLVSILVTASAKYLNWPRV